MLKAYEFLKLKEDETMKVLETASSLRSQNKKIVVVSLDEYMELLESKKH